MPVVISMLRGVNVGPHNRIKMDALRALYESLALEDARTYVQSGNVVFRTTQKHLPLLAKKIQKGIEKKFGCCPEVLLRTTNDMKKVVAANPFAGRDRSRARFWSRFSLRRRGAARRQRWKSSRSIPRNCT